MSGLVPPTSFSEKHKNHGHHHHSLTTLQQPHEMVETKDNSRHDTSPTSSSTRTDQAVAHPKRSHRPHPSRHPNHPNGPQQQQQPQEGGSSLDVVLLRPSKKKKHRSQKETANPTAGAAQTKKKTTTTTSAPPKANRNPVDPHNPLTMTTTTTTAATETKPSDDPDHAMTEHLPPHKDPPSNSNNSNNNNKTTTKNGSSSSSSDDWNDLVQEMRNLLQTQTQNNKQRTEDFLDGVERRSMATTELEQVVQECQRTMEEALEALMQQVVVQVHAQCQQLLQEAAEENENDNDNDKENGNEHGNRGTPNSLESEIILAITQNHKNRKRLLQRIEQAQRAYMNQNDTLMARVENPSKHRQGTSMSPDGDDDDDENAFPQKEPSPHKDWKDGGGGRMIPDPDWDVLVQEHEPNREKVQAFLDGRAQKAHAEEVFERGIQQVHQQLQEQVVQAMIQAAVRIHHETSEQVLSELEQDVQQYILNNHQRRQAFKKSLEESTKRAQGFFADTLARVRAGIGRGGGGGKL